MIAKAITAFAVLFLIGQIIGWAVEGNSTLAVTRLTVVADEDDTTFTVTSTTGYKSRGLLFVKAEVVRYTSKDLTHFYGLTRGFSKTDPVDHAIGQRVYNEVAGTLNQGIGFQMADSLSNSGPFRVLTTLPGFLGSTVARFVVWDNILFTQAIFGFPLVYIQMFLICISLGLIATLLFLFLPVAWGLISRIL